MVFREFISKNLPIKREDAKQPLQRLQSDMNRIFDRFFEDFRMLPFQNRDLASFPRIDIKETKKEVLVSAELPGMDVKDIDISITNPILTLRGEKEQESKHEEEDYYHMERSYGSFNRSIPLPSEVESDNVKAEFKNGLLKVSMTKKPEAQQKGKKIEIKVN